MESLSKCRSSLKLEPARSYSMRVLENAQVNGVCYLDYLAPLVESEGFVGRVDSVE